jgi:hypothetical protein
LIRLRVLSFLFLVAAIVGPLRRIAGRHSPLLTTLGLAAMFLPGFSESLVRCSNDGLLFLWAALVIDAVDGGYRGAALAVLPAFGCLIKLNALPILVFVLALLWIERRRKTLLLAATMALVPVAILGGSTWGGAVKIAKRMPLPMPALEIAVGLARSLYTIVKGAVWVGEWSFFRPPAWLLAPGVAVLAVLVAGTRRVSRPRRLRAHVAALAVAAVGTVAFVLADRRVFGGWGGVGGWYVWGWAPWLAILADDALRWRGRTRLAILGIGVFLFAINVSWFVTAGRVYGSDALFQTAREPGHRSGIGSRCRRRPAVPAIATPRRSPKSESTAPVFTPAGGASAGNGTEAAPASS